MSKSANLNYHTYFITKTRIKNHIHEKNLECSDGIFEALNSKISDIINEGIKRTKKNARKRVLARDV